jgi:Ca2+-binding RTX toxin-like protein
VDAGAGNDIILAGTDTVGDFIEAGAGNDTVTAGAGNDTLCGSSGVDQLTGGLGSDLFELCAAGSGNIDTITDFSVVNDTIQLDRSAFISFTVTGTLAIDNLAIGTTAVDFNDYLIYNSTTGELLYDADGSGSGAAVQIALLGAGLALTNTDFVVG